MLKFQFHLVRLKVQADNTYDTDIFVSIPFSTIKSASNLTGKLPVTEFQFHLVRLKEQLLNEQLRNNLFQFHLVRLKVMKNELLLDTFAVSIPFSTIKRHTKDFFINDLNDVSIPFSTIKSAPPYGKKNLLAVSIPFSTIKSSYHDWIETVYTSFQFHLVRLKEGKGKQTPQSVIRFNSI